MYENKTPHHVQPIHTVDSSQLLASNIFRASRNEFDFSLYHTTATFGKDKMSLLKWGLSGMQYHEPADKGFSESVLAAHTLGVPSRFWHLYSGIVLPTVMDGCVPNLLSSQLAVPGLLHSQKHKWITKLTGQAPA